MHSQAIHTKYLPASNTRPARIKATCGRGSLTLPIRQADTAHIDTARALCDKFCKQDGRTEGNPWNDPFVSGGLPDGSMVHVFTFDLKAVFSAPESDPLPEAIGRAIAAEFGLWKRDGGYALPGHSEPFSPRGIACRAARIFLETKGGAAQ